MRGIAQTKGNQGSGPQKTVGCDLSVWGRSGSHPRDLVDWARRWGNDEPAACRTLNYMQGTCNCFRSMAHGTDPPQTIGRTSQPTACSNMGDADLPRHPLVANTSSGIQRAEEGR